MAVRFIMHPVGIRSTPISLGTSLSARLRQYPGRLTGDYTRDLFLVYPPSNEVITKNREMQYHYELCRNFFSRDKAEQRVNLNVAYSIPVPATYTDHDSVPEYTLPGHMFVVRPLRHHGGRDYVITPDPHNFVEGEQYISELWPKEREYRVIFAFGKPVVWLRKKPNPGVSADAAWNYGNTVFQTINDTAGSKLAQTDCIAKLLTVPAIQHAHIVAVDVMWKSGKNGQPAEYAVLELNTCPAITIEDNLNTVVAATKAHFGEEEPVRTTTPVAQPPAAQISNPLASSAAPRRQRVVTIRQYSIYIGETLHPISEEDARALLAELRVLFPE